MPHRALIVTADPDLLDDLLRLAVLAGVEVEVAPDVVAARPSWPRAPVVLLGCDLAGGVLPAGLPRRAGVVLVARSESVDPAAWQWAARVGAEAVHPLPAAETLLIERLVAAGSGAGGGPGGGPGRTVAVVAGVGGAGASTLAAALAVSAGQRAFARRTLLVDLDPLGGGLDLLLGAEAAAGLRWPALVGTRGAADPEELRAALPVAAGVAVLSWDRGDPAALPLEALESVLVAGRRGHDLVVLDLPRSHDPATLAAVATADAALVVVRADLRAAAAAARVAAGLTGRVADVRLVVREAPGSRLPAGPVARAVGLPLAGRLGHDPGLAAAVERGEPPGRMGRGPLGQLCRSLLTDLVGPAGLVA